MSASDLDGILAFLRAAEALKNVTRSAWTSGGQPESVAEHSWRLCLMALALERELGGVDIARLLKLCIIHDLGEAIGGDIPAIHQAPGTSKSVQERADLLTLAKPLPEKIRAEIVALWDEYDAARTTEARIAKALDKLETIMQHNQGKNPADFDYEFNLGYGRAFTAAPEVVVAIREILDRETKAHARGEVSSPPEP